MKNTRTSTASSPANAPCKAVGLVGGGEAKRPTEEFLRGGVEAAFGLVGEVAECGGELGGGTHHACPRNT